MIPWSTMNYGNYGNYGRYVDAWGWKPLMYPEWEWWPNNYGNKKGVETNFWKGTDGVFWTNLFCLILIVNFPMLEKTVMHHGHSRSVLPSPVHPIVTPLARPCKSSDPFSTSAVGSDTKSPQQSVGKCSSSRSQWKTYLVTLQHFDEPKKKCLWICNNHSDICLVVAYVAYLGYPNHLGKLKWL
jgi:hypothetical protein